MKKREFLMLAQTYSEQKHGESVIGWLMSEKLDGMRAFWDGGLSRDMLASSVPWANTLHDDRKKSAPVCTGLWTRYGNIINAPESFLEQLPPFPLDGELFHNQDRQRTISICSRDNPTSDWKDITYYVFESPSLTATLSPVPYRASAKELVHINDQWLQDFLDEQIEKQVGIPSKHVEWSFRPKTFQEVVLNNEGYANLLNSPQVQFLKQVPIESLDHMYSELARVRAHGGEGLMLRKPSSMYECKRSHSLLKLKNISFGSAEVLGYTTGRATDRGSKLLGLMGNVHVLWNGKRFELSGFTDAERELEFTYKAQYGQSAKDWAANHPETVCDTSVHNPKFPRGSRINFIYRGLTRDGIPQEARYHRSGK